MPVKWTVENDQLLLLKILETHELSVDTKKVAEAWPTTDPKSKPTPRAITERLVRLRQIVKASSSNNDGHFSIGKGAAGSASSTPRKPRTKSTPGSHATPSSGKKRKPTDKCPGDEDEGVHVKMELAEDDEDDDDIQSIDTPTRKKSSFDALSMDSPGLGRIGTTLKLEPAEEDPFSGGMSPTKRVRKASTLAPGMVQYTADEDDNAREESESSASEYQPQQMEDYDSLVA